MYLIILIVFFSITAAHDDKGGVLGNLKCSGIKYLVRRCHAFTESDLKKAVIQDGEETGMVDLSPGEPFGPDCPDLSNVCKINVKACTAPVAPQLVKVGEFPYLQIVAHRNCKTGCEANVTIDVIWTCKVEKND